MNKTLLEKLKAIAKNHNKYVNAKENVGLTYEEYIEKFAPQPPARFPLFEEVIEQEGNEETKEVIEIYDNYNELHDIYNQDNFISKTKNNLKKKSHKMLYLWALIIGIIFTLFGFILAIFINLYLVGVLLATVGVILIIFGSICLNKANAEIKKELEKIEINKKKIEDEYPKWKQCYDDCKEQYENEKQKYNEKIKKYEKERDKYYSVSHKKEYNNYINDCKSIIESHEKMMKIISSYSNFYSLDEQGLNRLNVVISYLSDGSAISLEEAIKLLRETERNKKMLEEKKKIDIELAEIKSSNDYKIVKEKMAHEKEMEKLKYKNALSLQENEHRRQNSLMEAQKKRGYNQCIMCKNYSKCTSTVRDNNLGNCASYTPDK